MRLYTRVPFDNLDVCLWQFPFILGIVWKLYENKRVHVQEWLAGHKAIAVIASICLLIATVIIRMYAIIPHWSGMRIDGFIACAVALSVITILRSSKYLMSTFAFLGKHSMNIYMTHTFINAYWFDGWLHSGEWMRGGGNFVLLMIICLIISIVIEFMKEKIRYYECVKYITKRI